MNVTVSPGTTMPANLQESRRSRVPPPAASDATVAINPICSMPCAMTPSSPSALAASYNWTFPTALPAALGRVLFIGEPGHRHVDEGRVSQVDVPIGKGAWFILGG